MEPSASPDPAPADHASPAKRSAWKQPAPNGVVHAPAPAPGPAPALIDANHWPALSETAKNTKLAVVPDSSSSRPPPPDSSSPSGPVASSAAIANSSNSQKHASASHQARHKPARRGGGSGGDHSPRDHLDRSTGAWDHASAGSGGGRGAQRNHNNGGARRGNGTTASAAAVSHHGGAGGGFGGRRRGAYEPFYRGPPPMGMGPYMRGAPPPPPPMTVAPPFMGPPPPPGSPMRPFAGPMVFHDIPSPVSPVSPVYFFGPPPPPEALRGLPLAPPMVGPPVYPYFQAPPEPQPETEPEPDADDKHAKLLTQIEFYFSKENLCSDVYLRQQMDGQGWVDISLIARFNKVQELTKDLQYIKETVQSSSILEMKGDKIRKRDDWDKWVIPRESNPDIPSSSASAPSSNVNNLTAHIGGMGLDDSARPTSAADHHEVIKNGSPSGNDQGPASEDSPRQQ